MIPDQTAPKGEVWSGSYYFHYRLPNFISRWEREDDNSHVWLEKGYKLKTYIKCTLLICVCSSSHSWENPCNHNFMSCWWFVPWFRIDSSKIERSLGCYIVLVLLERTLCRQRIKQMLISNVLCWCVCSNFRWSHRWYLSGTVGNLCLYVMETICSWFHFDSLHVFLYTIFCQHRIYKRKAYLSQKHEISNNVVLSTSKGSDQPAHPRSLIRAFASRLNILWL